jgi:hypothetical protein
MADVYTLTSDHCTGGCGTSPFGTIDVTQDGFNTVLLTVNLTSGDNFVNTGFPGAFAFDISGAPTIAVLNLTTGWSLVSTTAAANHFDGFGNLDYALTCGVCGSGGSNAQPGPLSFDVTATDLTPTSFEQLSSLPPGSQQAFFVADILGANGNTGPVGAVDPPSAVPEPGAPALLGLAGSFFFAVSRLRRRQTA